MSSAVLAGFEASTERPGPLGDRSTWAGSWHCFPELATYLACFACCSSPGDGSCRGDFFSTCSATAALVSWADRAWVSTLSTGDPDLQEDAAPAHVAEHFRVCFGYGINPTDLGGSNSYIIQMLLTSGLESTKTRIIYVVKCCWCTTTWK